MLLNFASSNDFSHLLDHTHTFTYVYIVISASHHHVHLVVTWLFNFSCHCVLQDLANMTTKLEYLTKHSRLEHFDKRDANDSTEDKAREERRRQEERRLRQRQRMSRDPHHKLAQKVEDRRRLGWESWAQSIPIQQIEVSPTGALGSKKVGLVDVSGLKARSKLSQNSSVDALLQQRRREEKTCPASVA